MTILPAEISLQIIESSCSITPSTTSIHHYQRHRNVEAIPQSILYALSLTSRSWNQVATDVLYATPRLSSPRSIALLHRTITSFPALAGLVKQIYFHDIKIKVHAYWLISLLRKAFLQSSSSSSEDGTEPRLGGVNLQLIVQQFDEIISICRCARLWFDFGYQGIPDLIEAYKGDEVHLGLSLFNHITNSLSNPINPTTLQYVELSRLIFNEPFPLTHLHRLRTLCIRNCRFTTLRTDIPTIDHDISNGSSLETLILLDSQVDLWIYKPRLFETFHSIAPNVSTFISFNTSYQSHSQLHKLTIDALSPIRPKLKELRLCGWDEKDILTRTKFLTNQTRFFQGLERFIVGYLDSSDSEDTLDISTWDLQPNDDTTPSHITFLYNSPISSKQVNQLWRFIRQNCFPSAGHGDDEDITLLDSAHHQHASSRRGLNVEIGIFGEFTVEEDLDGRRLVRELQEWCQLRSIPFSVNWLDMDPLAYMRIQDPYP
ncbi:hypothetical protein C8Q75DRAFT_811890 [Abortiporus biennis]|nr:hypothetical protein C8Q75DRAFT_811890 [Abortiporus biennis]